MTENQYLDYCKAQVNGPLKEEDLILMLTAWGHIKYSIGYNQALKDNGIEPKQPSAGTEELEN
ncbi:hypothetical protein [Pedobacter gandavensis]|uniref:Uncharacterized protein n=1 Tax=Pedobacter gandavensis TaxID=2679963 RepID=A0ABR6F0C4_9SPHI|nr:hypothetical protein [Pedobacter gandavensis]MBB2150672.1 hypothetical protein [Pedobacter gandavensis]